MLLIQVILYDTPESNLEIRKCKRRSHDKRQKGNDKREICAAQKSCTSFNNLSSKLREHGQYGIVSFLSSLPIPVLHILDIEAIRSIKNSGEVLSTER